MHIEVGELHCPLASGLPVGNRLKGRAKAQKRGTSRVVPMKHGTHARRGDGRWRHEVDEGKEKKGHHPILYRRKVVAALCHTTRPTQNIPAKITVSCKDPDHQPRADAKGSSH